MEYRGPGFNPNPAGEIRAVSEEQTFRSKDNALCL
jgi:hypothetical protein